MQTQVVLDSMSVGRVGRACVQAVFFSVSDSCVRPSERDKKTCVGVIFKCCG